MSDNRGVVRKHLLHSDWPKLIVFANLNAIWKQKGWENIEYVLGVHFWEYYVVMKWNTIKSYTFHLCVQEMYVIISVYNSSDHYTYETDFIVVRKTSTFLYSVFVIHLILKAPITTAADNKFYDIFLNFRQIRYGISWESSASRGFSWNIMPYSLFLKKQQNLKSSSAANCRWRFMEQYPSDLCFI